jgi:malate synthase
MSNTHTPDGIRINAPVTDAFSRILTPEALAFVGDLARRFDDRRRELMARRETVQAGIDAGVCRTFCPKPRLIRDGDWTVAPVPTDLADRRVEITGPVDRKMVINALNSGAKTFMADFEDSHCPSWSNTIDGQINLRDAVNRTIEFKNPAGKTYRLNDQTATLIVRPRGWHLVEKHVLVDGSRYRAAFLTSAFISSTTPKPSGPRQRPLFLSAQDGKPPGSTPVERCLHCRPGGLGHPDRNHQGNGADRDHHGRLRDG